MFGWFLGILGEKIKNKYIKKHNVLEKIKTIWIYLIIFWDNKLRRFWKKSGNNGNG